MKDDSCSFTNTDTLAHTQESMVVIVKAKKSKGKGGRALAYLVCLLSAQHTTVLKYIFIDTLTRPSIFCTM